MPSPGRFDSRARVLRERVPSESIEVRHIISRDKRELSVDSARDGMAGLTAHLPAASVQAIYNREADVAAGLHSPDEPRTLFRLREDVFCVLLIDGVTAESRPTHPNLGTLTVSACSSRCRCSPSVATATPYLQSSAPGFACGVGPAGPRDAVPPLGAAISTRRRIGSTTVTRTTTISRTSARNTTTRSSTPGGPASISARVAPNGSRLLVTGT